MFALFLGSQSDGTVKTLAECKSQKCTVGQIEANMRLFLFESHVKVHRMHMKVTDCVDADPEFAVPVQYTIFLNGAKTPSFVQTTKRPPIALQKP